MIHRFSRDERGIAMITALLASMVVLALSVVTVELSIHNSDSSSLDKKRVQGIDAAEAGIDSVLSIIQGATVVSLPCGSDRALPISPPSSYHVTVAYYKAFPPGDGDIIDHCPLVAQDTPKAAVLTSTGTSYSTSTRPAKRTMKTEVGLVQAGGGGVGTGSAIYASRSLTDSGSFTGGNQGNDGNILVNGDLDCSGSAWDKGNVWATGAITGSGGCRIDGDMIAGTSISISNGTILNNMTAATSTITMSTTTVGKDVHSGSWCKNGSTCVSHTGGITGTVYANTPTAPPTLPQFPQLNLTQPTDWPGYNFQTFSTCASAVTYLTGTLPDTPTVVRITPACSFPGSGSSLTITLHADLAIVTDGAINMSGVLTVNSSVANVPHTMYMMVPYTQLSTCPNGGNTTGSFFKFGNSVIFNGNTPNDPNKWFAYTPCDVTITNVGDGGLTGQLFGQNITTSSAFSLNYLPIQIPGVPGGPGFQINTVYLREVPNPK